MSKSDATFSYVRLEVQFKLDIKFINHAEVNGYSRTLYKRQLELNLNGDAINVSS